jgi:tRNA modification GTPase
MVEISAKNHAGIDNLGEKIKEIFLHGQLEYGQDIVTNSRHIALLNSAKDALTEAIAAIDNDMFIDLIAIDIQAAYALIGEITGAVVEEELIEKIFSEFCLGK